MLDRAKARKEPWDVVVIGGGATGVGCVLDAASRGLDVLLLEAADFGKGTSGRSTKLIHGGVRYLAQGNIPLVREALRERHTLRSIAPHHVQVQEFVLPCYGTFEKFLYAAGLKLYSLLAGDRSFGTTRLLSRSETIARMPGLKRTGLKGGVLYHDGRFDDARLLIDMAVTAEEQRAVLLNYAPVRSIDRNEQGRAVGVTFEDLESGERIAVRARVVINAAGIFSTEVASLCGERKGPKLSFSQGVHVVFDQEVFQTNDALLIPKTRDGRVLFAIPWHDKVLAGTTDTPIKSPKLEPAALPGEVDLILETFSQYAANAPGRKDVRSVFAGVRPLVDPGNGEATKKMSRGHSISVTIPGLVSVTGGKWTTYRLMAEETVDLAVEDAGLSCSSCRTPELEILNREVSRDADAELLVEGFDYTPEDVVRAVREEMARSIDDVLARRTRLLLLDAKAAMASAPAVAAIMAEELGWSAEERVRKLEEFESIARNYFVSADQASGSEI